MPTHVELGQRFEQALIYALRLHTKPRVTGVPTFSHLMAVSGTVLENGGDETEAIAALLHDAAEDYGGQQRLADIETLFGSDVARIVAGCSDSLPSDASERPPWEERKIAFLKALPHRNSSVWRVAVADKLHNGRAMQREARLLGASFWTRLGRTAEQTVAYFTLAHRTLERVLPCHTTGELGVVAAQLETAFCGPQAFRARIEEFERRLR
jgi:(p)ppGpp synthase/HD superfamily hydrolase